MESKQKGKVCDKMDAGYINKGKVVWERESV